MNTQTLINPVMTLNFVVALPETDLLLESPIYADSRDYGFDFDEEELARELIMPLPASLEDQPIPKVDAEEFESRYSWFLS